MSDSFATPWTLSSSVHGISQARILDGVAISFSRGSFQPRDWTYASCIGRRILYYWATWKIPWKKTVVLKNILSTLRRLISSTYAALSVLDSEHPNTSPELRLVTQSCLTLCNPMDSSLLGSPVHGDSPGRNTEVGCHALLQGIFPTQGLKPGLPHCKQILCHLSHQGSSVPTFVCNRNMHNLGKDRVPCVFKVP